MMVSDGEGQMCYTVINLCSNFTMKPKAKHTMSLARASATRRSPNAGRAPPHGPTRTIGKLFIGKGAVIGEVCEKLLLPSPIRIVFYNVLQLQIRRPGHAEYPKRQAYTPNGTRTRILSTSVALSNAIVKWET